MTFCYLLLLTVGFISCVYFSNPTFLITWLITLRFVTRLVFLNDLLNWLIYVIILLFTGGIIVLFAYMTSLVTRYKINFPPISKFVILLSLPLISLLNCQNYSFAAVKTISRLYLESWNLIILFIALYLLMVLVSIVKIATALWGPIKSSFLNDKQT